MPSSEIGQMRKYIIQQALKGLLILSFASFATLDARSQQKPNSVRSDATCRVETVDYMGWQAQQVSNLWVKLIFVPQNGGRLMQVIFDGHPFLFVNPEYGEISSPFEY